MHIAIRLTYCDSSFASRSTFFTQKLIKARKLRPSWLTPGEAEEEEFLQFSTKDHQKDEGIEPVLIKDLRFKPKRGIPSGQQRRLRQ